MLKLILLMLFLTVIITMIIILLISIERQAHIHNRIRNMDDEQTQFKKSGIKKKGDILRDFFGKSWTNLLEFVYQIAGRDWLRSTAKTLARAGYYHPNAAFVYVSVSVVLQISLAMGFLLLPILKARTLIINLSLMLAGFLVGRVLSARWLTQNIDQYRRNIRLVLPDAVEIIQICLESGYSIDNALERISDDFVKYAPEIAHEFDLTAAELRITDDRQRAWRNLADRLEIEELYALVAALQQSEKYGTPLRKSLKTLIAHARRSRVIRAEQKAAKLPVFMTIPLVIFFVPVIFMVILGPAAINAFKVLTAL